jgi:hypothetical protein
MGIIFLVFVWASFWIGCALDDVCYEQNTNPHYYIEGKPNG